MEIVCVEYIFDTIIDILPEVVIMIYTKLNSIYIIDVVTTLNSIPTGKANMITYLGYVKYYIFLCKCIVCVKYTDLGCLIININLLVMGPLHIPKEYTLFLIHRIYYIPI